ncbi:MAG TPA: hypothetical protein VFP72_14570 [Kineosporiaceae bacterium]|nr:hypothetical protein [Kineosporiaceae bacterium]
MSTTSDPRAAARRVKHRQAARAANRARWAGLARSTVRDLLLAGPAGGDRFGAAIVALLDAGDLLSHDGFVAHCVQIRDEEPSTWADLDPERLRACARGELPIELEAAQQRLIHLAVSLFDLAGHLHAREYPDVAQAVRSAVAAVLARPRPGRRGACCSFWDGPHDVPSVQTGAVR